MARTLLWVGIAALAIVGVVGLLYIFTEGALFSRPHHEWRVELDAQGEGAWSVDVPRPVRGSGVHTFGNASLAALLATLRVASGEATFELRDDALRVSGTGDAVVEAARRASRSEEGFADWRVSGANVSRADDASGPTLLVRWSVDFDGGRGHACWARATHETQVAPGETRPLAEPRGPTPEPHARLWQTACA